ncbi:MAG: autotransporter-associated beta strand repeat-containing protein [Verrucomicrobiaceae bacterium]|nr:autotransporter-associated beta strand repeat-containing protein [Verrucomicrobiaceae bacterium]
MLTNNGNGLVTYGGTVWGNTDTTARTLTVNGTGTTLLSGSITATGATHNFTKNGTGTVTVQGTGSTLTGNVNVNNGTLIITDFRSLNNNTGTINIGSNASNTNLTSSNNNAAGTLTIGTATAPSAAGLTTSKVINLAGTTNGATINASQSGTNPVIFNAAFTATGINAKTLTLGGTSTVDNIINGAIVNNATGQTQTAANYSSGATTITLASVEGIIVGDAISGTGIPASTTITAINTGTKVVTISAATTAAITATTTITTPNVQNPTSLIKTDAGTWVLAGANTYTGSTTITGGTLKLKANAAASTVLGEAAGNTVVFNANATTATAGGTLEFVGVSGSATTESLGSLTPTAGASTVKLTSGGGGAAANLIFGSLGTVSTGTGVNFSTTGGGGGTVTVTGAANTNGIVNAHLYANGADFAASTAGVIGASATTSIATGSMAAGNASPYLITGAISQNTALVNAGIKFASNQTVTLNASQTLTINNSGVSTGATTSGGILVAGATNAIITGGTGITTGGTGDLVVRVDGATDQLTIGSVLTAGTTGGLTKNGAGKLILSAANLQTGATTINEGTVQLSGGTSRLSGASAALNLRQGATLDINGVNTGTAIGAFNGAGIVTNNGAAASLTVGGGNGTGTFSGVIQDGTGVISVIKAGTGNQTWSGLNTYTGSTTIGSTGLVSVTTLANYGSNSSIGKGITSTLSDANNAASLVFNGTTGGIAYTGTTSVSIDRLFTMSGGGQITNNSGNNSTLVLNKTNAITFGTTAAQTLTLGGSSTGDNQINSQLVNPSAGNLSLSKIGAGLWILGNASNSYSGTTQIGLTTTAGGVLQAVDGSTLPTTSPLVLGGTTGGGVFQTSGNFTRNITATPVAGTGTVTFNSTLTSGGVGFSASDSKLVVAIGGLGGPTALTWGAGGFMGVTGTSTGAFVLSSSTALSEVEVRNAIDLNGVNRTIQVDDNANTFADFATITGVISGTGGLTKTGAGTLQLLAANTYSGPTAVTAASTLVVNSLGLSTGPTVGTSLGTSAGANLAANALTLGNAGTTAGILQYVGPGETSDRMIRLNTTTGSTQIHADGSGPLILTNVLNDMAAGNKTLFLRGANPEGNMITSVLADNIAGTNTLGVTVDSSATWILTGVNTYTGVTDVTGGALGAGDNAAFGTGTLRVRNGSLFAYGADRTLTNPLADTSTNTAITSTFIGDYSLNLSSNWTHTNTTAGQTLTNSIATGKTLTLGGDMQWNSLTGNATLTVNGSGDTIFNGNLTTSSNVGISLTYAGTGSLTASGTGWDLNGGSVSLNGGKFVSGANELIPNGAPAAITSTTAAVSGTGASKNISVANTAGLVVGQPILGTGVAANTYVSAIIDGNTFTATVSGGNANTSWSIASGVTLNFDSKGNVTMNPAVGATSTWDLNGKTETINGLAAGSALGNVVITNSSATPASLIVGDGGANTVAFGGGAGTATISETGGGSINLTKAGTGTANITGTLGNTGSTTVNGGVLNYNSPTGTTSLSVANSGTLNLKGGLTTPANLTTVSVAGGGFLSFADGAGTPFNNLTTLSLGVGSGTATLELEAGDLGTDTLTLLTGNVATTANTINLLVKDFDISNGQTYNLLVAPSGGLLTGGGSTGTYTFSLAGYTGSVLNQSDTLVSITAGTLITSDVYWNGGTSPATTAWNTVDGFGNTNFSTDLPGVSPAITLPGKGQKVIFVADNLTGGSALSTTLEQPFKINALEFRASTTPANTPSSITIGPGTVTSNSLTIAPSSSADGIKMLAGATPTLNISAPVVAQGAQSWTVTDATQALNVSGALSGSGNVTKLGSGKLTLSAAGTSYTGAFAVNAGTAELTVATALSGVVATPGSGAAVSIGGTGAFYYNNATAGTVPNNLTLAGGTLSAAGNGQTYSGSVTTTALTTSTINLRDANSATTTTTQRNITLSGTISGTGGITLDSIDTVTAGNQLSGTLTINKGASTWNGDLNMSRGTVVFTNVAGGGTLTPYVGYNGIINFNQFGRVIYRNVDGGSLSRTADINYAASAVGELSVDNLSAGLTSNYTVTQSGALNLNGGSIVRLNLADVASNLVLSGGVTLNGNASLSSIGGDADSLTTIQTVGISGTGDLAINDQAGAWGQTATRVAINVAGSYAGNTSLTGGTLILGNKSALSSGSLTIAGTSSIEAGVNLAAGGSGPVANALNLGATLTTAGTNNLTFSGIVTNSVDASRTLTNNITSPAELVFSGTTFNLAPAASTTARTLTVNGTGNTTINNLIQNNGTGASVVAKGGSGTLTLGGANSYTGGTTINLGTVKTSASNVLPNTGTITVNQTAAGASATLDLNGNSDTIAGLTFGGTSGIAGSVNQVLTGAGTLTLGGTVTVTATGNWTTPALLSGNVALGANRTFSVADSTGTTVDLDVPAALSGAFSLTKSGAGMMQVSSTSNSYSGGTVINLGTIRTGASNVIPNTGAVTVNQTATGTSATLDLNGNSDTIGALTFGGTSGIAGSVNQVLTGAGTLTLGGNVTVTATGNWTTSALLSGNLALGATRTFSIANSTGVDVDLDVQAVVSGSGFGITKTGAGTLQMSAANTYTGATVINNGVFRYGINSALDAANAVTVNANAASTTATLDLNGFNGTIGSLTLGGTGQTSTSASVVQTGAGVLTLGGNVTTNATGSPATTALITGNLNLGAADRTFSVADSTGSLVDLDVQSVIAGSVGLTKTGAGALQLSGTNTFSGKVTIADGPLTVSVVDATATANQPLGTHTELDLGVAGTSSGSLVYSGAAGTLAKNINVLGNGSDTIQNLGSGALTLTGTITKSGTTLTLAGGSAGITVSGLGTITGTLTSSDLIINGGTTTLASANSYNGPTYIRNGATLNANATDALPTANGRSNIIMDDSGSGSSILSLGAGQSIASLAGAATSSVNLGANTLTIGSASGTTTFSGVISGVGGGLVKDGASTLVLGGPNTYDGTTLINDGTVEVTHASGLGSTSGGTTVANGATLYLNNVNVGAEPITINGNGVGGLGALKATGSSTITSALNINTDSYIGVPNLSDTLYLQGNLTGSAGYTKIGAGTVVVSGSGSTYSGVTTVSAGTLLVTDPNALGGTGGGTVVAPGAILELGSGVSIGAEDLVLQSTGGSNYGTLRSGSGSNTWGGNITFTGGFGGLSAAPGATLNLTGATINKTDVALFITGGGTVNINNVIGGDGDTGEFNDDLNVVGTTVQLNALNTYTGPTNVYNGGTLRNGITDALPNSSTVGSSGSTTLTLGHASDGAVTNTYDLNGYNQTVATLNSVITGTNANIITNQSATADSTLSVSAGDFSGIIQDGGSGKTVNLIKQGDVADVLVLKGSNTYTGTTVVMNGTLQVGYNAVGSTGTGNVTVQTTGSIAGTGTILGTTTISGVLTPGDLAGAGLGVLHVGADLTLTGTSDSYFQIGDPNLVFDQVHNTLGTSTLALGGFIDAGSAFAGGYVGNYGDSWALFTNWASITGSFNAGTNLRSGGTGGGALNLPTLTPGLLWDVTQFTVNGTISITAVPEPSRALLLLVGLVGILGTRRRRLQD